MRIGFIALFLVGRLFLPSSAAGQDSTPSAAPEDTLTVEKVDLLHADELRKDTRTELHLTGAVHLKQGMTDLHSDEATEYSETEDILFVGNVRITERGDTLTADRVRYNKRTKTGVALGNVHLSDGSVVVSAPSATYFADEKRAVFEEGVTLADSASVLTSRRGAYWSDEKRAEFYEDVRLTGDRTYLEADSITFFREDEISIARGDVFIERLPDSTDVAPPSDRVHSFLFGEHAFNDNQAVVSRISGNPLLVRFRTDSTGAMVDTLVVSAERLETARRDSLERMTASGAVRIWQPSFSAVGDSIVYEQSRAGITPPHEESRMYRGPAAWFQEAQVTGDTLRITGRSGGVDTLFVVGNAFVARRDTATNRISQLKGRAMRGEFKRDTLRTLFVQPNAQAIYFMRDKDSGQTKGAVRASSDRLVFDMKGNGELRDIRFFGGVEGQMYDKDLIPDPMELDGFRWYPEQRPRRFELLTSIVLDRIDRRITGLRSGESPEPPAAGNNHSSNKNR